MRSYHFPGRSPVVARHAMVATSHPAASLAAVECLKRGGNALDAAITATALLCVVEPAMTGIGGDCFALIHKPGQKLIALNGSGRAPAAATAAWYAKAGIAKIEVTSPHAVTVPGAIDAWDRLLKDHGSISLAAALAPAIEAAEGGFAVQPRVSHDWAGLATKIALDEGARRHLLKDGRTPHIGEVMRFPALAKTLTAIARQGRDAFYGGEIAADIVACLKAKGGLHEVSDFAATRSNYVEPISVTYNGVELHEMPPNNQGIVALMILKMLEQVGPVESRDPMSPERLHIMMEASRLAYAARDEFLADPAMADVPVAHMLSDDFAKTLARRIDRRKRMADLGPIPKPAGTDTVYLTVADQNGMVVSFINSLFAGFGSGIVAPNSGVVLQNRGSGFVLTPGHVNGIAPGKRPLHTLVPAMASRAGKLWLSFGVMGGAYQPLGHVHVLTNRLDYGLDAQESIDLPRAAFEDEKLLVEASLPQATRAALSALGHPVGERKDPWGGAQLIELDHANGTLIGASDPRKDGMALGY
jgi:gamma-glutamyltranspeptidase / glutathione hydrolase